MDKHEFISKAIIHGYTNEKIEAALEEAEKLMADAPSSFRIDYSGFLKEGDK